MEPKRVIWVVLLMAAALFCWLSVPSFRPTPVCRVDTSANSQHKFLLGTTVSGATNSTITGILTDPQFRVVIRALEQRGSPDVLAAPKATTRPGRAINRIDFVKTIVFTNK